MKFYTSNNLLIRENPETKIIRVCNRTNKINIDNHIITSDEFSQMEKKQVKKDKWSELMNNWFRSVKHEWIHDFSNFRKLDNFDFRLSSNYLLGKDVPYHKLENKPYYGNLVLVYHWGKIYYHTVSYNGYPQGQLMDINTFKFVKWTRLKNCAPIFNVNTKKIC
jgi:hypothetical protein